VCGELLCADAFQGTALRNLNRRARIAAYRCV
jgi:hypothetical protein